MLGCFLQIPAAIYASCIPPVVLLGPDNPRRPHLCNDGVSQAACVKLAVLHVRVQQRPQSMEVRLAWVKKLKVDIYFVKSVLFGARIGAAAVRNYWLAATITRLAVIA